MIFDYYTKTKSITFLQKFLPVAEIELNWWLENRQIKFIVPGDNQTQTLFQYRVLFFKKIIHLIFLKSKTNCPRPENFLEDYQLGIQSGIEPELYWSSMASACESGIDFSSRWFHGNNSK